MNTATAAATKPTDYLHIAAWGRQLHSFQYYISDQQERAFATGAPLDAVYEKSLPGGERSGQWVRISECSPSTQESINADVAFMKQRLAK